MIETTRAVDTDLKVSISLISSEIKLAQNDSSIL
jgi:hypothetical protein